MIKKSFFLHVLLWGIIPASTLIAQNSGIITYQKIVDYGIEPNGMDRWDNFIKDLPKTGTFVFMLTFNEEASLFREDPTKRAEVSPLLQRALGGAARFNPPKVKVLQIYQHLGKAETVQQVEFMTRNFIVTETISTPEWKITSNKKKVLDYICVGAEMPIGEEMLTAWFTSEIPVAFGPDGYHGLPGLILGVEKDGNMLALATEIDFSNAGNVEVPSSGQKIDVEAFEGTVNEKIKEWKANRNVAGSDRRGGN